MSLAYKNPTVNCVSNRYIKDEKACTLATVNERTYEKIKKERKLEMHGVPRLLREALEVNFVVSPF